MSSSCICTTDLESQKLEARAGGSSTSTRGTGGPRTRSAVQVRMPGRSGMPAAASCGSLCSPAFSERVSFQSVPHFARTDSIPFDGFFGARDIQAPCRRVVWPFTSFANVCGRPGRDLPSSLVPPEARDSYLSRSGSPGVRVVLCLGIALARRFRSVCLSATLHEPVAVQGCECGECVNIAMRIRVSSAPAVLPCTGAFWPELEP